jgi:hypothetical protein
MATGKLSALMAAGMQGYIAGLSPPKQDNYNFQDGYDALFNETEDYWNKVVEIDDDYTIPENGGNLTVILKSTGVTADPTIELPLLSTNIGRRLFFINENLGYRMVIRPKIGSSDTIEGFSVLDIMELDHKNRIELVATSYEWVRKSREFVLLPENRRPGWVLSAGTSTSWTDVSFKTWTQEGVNCLLLKFSLFQIGDDTNDRGTFSLRPKGSIIDDPNKNIVLSLNFTNLGTGITHAYADQVTTGCNDDGIIQYKQLTPSNGQLYLSINGYWK